jgi:hypothetical protein
MDKKFAVENLLGLFFINAKLNFGIPESRL